MYNPSALGVGRHARSEQMHLTRLIYRSENAMSVQGSRILIHYHDIVSTARRRNAETDVSGFLMFDRERYHQILEGRAEDVDELFARIAMDTRHRNVEVLDHRTIETRGFPDWSMGSFLSETPPHPLLIKHNMAPNQPASAEDFLAFALEFVAVASDAA